MKSYIKKHLFISIAVLSLSAIVVVILITKQNKEINYETIKVEKIDLTQEVEVTGKVRPSQELLLAFERGGNITNVKVSVGDEVSAGQSIASLDTSEMQAQLRQADASIVQQNNILIELQRGSRPEELVITTTSVSNAENSLYNAKIALKNVKEKAEVDLVSVYDSAFNSAQGSVISAKNTLVVVSEIQQTRFTESSGNASILSDAKSEAIEKLFDVSNAGKWDSKFVSDLSSGVFQEVQDAQVDISTEQQEEENIKLLLKVQEALLSVSNTLDVIPVLSTFTATEKAELSAQQTIISSAVATLSSKLKAIDVQKAANKSILANAEASVNTAENALKQAKNELALKESGSTSEAVATQMSRVTAARAAKELIQAQINTMTLKSPINGIVTKQDLRKGTFVQGGLQAVSIVSKNSYEVEVFVTEIDIAKVSVGDNVKITLDAYTDEDIFPAQVVSIDPAETMIEGVATYKVIICFLDNEDVRIKSGMTANAKISTDERKEVLAVPIRAIITEDSQKYIRVPDGNEMKKIPVEIGMKGSSGYVEVISGVEEGETVITFVRN